MPNLSQLASSQYVGAQGTQGIQGGLSPQGAQGSQGLQGASGFVGSDGAQGTQGIQGTIGSQGSQGLQGLQGLANQGVQGLQGTVGPQGSVAGVDTEVQFNDGGGTFGADANFTFNKTNPSVAIGTDVHGATFNVVPTATSIAGLFSGTTSEDMIRITQLGTGNAFVVEDSTNPDTTPFTITGIGSVGIGTNNPQSKLHIGAGTTVAGTAPLELASGSLLTIPEQGVIEYDGSFFYNTPNTTSGRAYIPPKYTFRRTTNDVVVGTAISDFFFTGPSSINLESASTYRIICFAYYTKTTSGTITWTHAFSSAPTVFSAALMYSPVTGIANGSQTNVLAYSGGQGQTTYAHAATASVTGGVNHLARFEVHTVTNAATNYRLRVTNGAGTVTPLAGSFYTVEKIGSSTGSFAA